MKNRQYIIIIIFVFVTVGLSFYSFTGNFTNQEFQPTTPSKPQAGNGDESFFKVVDLYLIENASPFLKLEAAELILTTQNSIILGFDTHGIVYRRNDKNTEVEPIKFEGKNSRLNTTVKELFLEKNVSVTMGTSLLNSENVKITRNGEEIEASVDVRTQTIDAKTNDQLNINSEYVIYRPKEEFFEYRRNVNGTINRKRQYEENVSFSTDLLTLWGPKGEVDMRGNVTFKKDNLDASANQGAVFLENYNKKLKYYSLSDDVRLQERLIMDGEPMTRKAFSEKLEGFISEKKIILTGLPKVFQQKDVIKGNRIIIRENIETVEVDDANTSITLEPQKAAN